MKVFFTSRSAMRNACFGKAVDAGKDSANRWVREITVGSRQKKVDFLVQTNPVTGKTKPVQVKVIKSRKLVAA